MAEVLVSHTTQTVSLFCWLCFVALLQPEQSCGADHYSQSKIATVAAAQFSWPLQGHKPSLDQRVALRFERFVNRPPSPTKV
eukprot:m.486412 g.486412  ORF g.486412 m.486412 type:complete len:82 (-) comp24396_c0_seq1:969-1214(-)